MKKELLTLGAVMAFVLTGAAQDGPFGVGVMLGEPTGVSLKYQLNERNAVDGGIGWSFTGDNNVHIHSDYLWHHPTILHDVSDQLTLYYGVGARAKFGGDTRIGVRGPVGVSYKIEQVPIDVFAEVGPVLDFTPGVRVSFTAAIGARFWF